MAAAGFTPISLYHTTTAAAAPTAGNLIAGELALNTTDGKLYYKTTAGAVALLASGAATTPVTSITFGTTGLTPSTATTGAVTVAGTLAVANGGTGATTLAGASIPTFSSTDTLTNKRITARVNVQSNITSPWAWNSDSFDQQEITALANALTINADAGTPTDGQKTIFRFQDSGVARALTWTTGTSKSFRAIGVTLPTTTVSGKTVYIGCIYNSGDARWDAIAVAQEA